MGYEINMPLYESVYSDAKTWYDLPKEIRDDLFTWLNVKTYDKTDKKRLFQLYIEGRFRAWNCPLCKYKDKNTRVFCAEPTEEELGYFQGTLDQDFSYFGDTDIYTEEYILALCDQCRCHG